MCQKTPTNSSSGFTSLGNYASHLSQVLCKFVHESNFLIKFVFVIEKIEAVVRLILLLSSLPIFSVVYKRYPAQERYE